jgi:hypothetical protein
MTVEKLKAELTEKMKQVPGYVPAFLQPIENRILMLYTGIRAQVGVKIYGDNLDKIQRKAFEIEKLINSIDGAAGVSPSRVQGKPFYQAPLLAAAALRSAFPPAHRAAHARDVRLLAVGAFSHGFRVHPAARRGRFLLPVHPQQQRRAFLRT